MVLLGGPLTAHGVSKLDMRACWTSAVYILCKRPATNGFHPVELVNDALNVGAKAVSTVKRRSSSFGGGFGNKVGAVTAKRPATGTGVPA